MLSGTYSPEVNQCVVTQLVKVPKFLPHDTSVVFDCPRGHHGFGGLNQCSLGGIVQAT